MDKGIFSVIDGVSGMVDGLNKSYHEMANDMRSLSTGIENYLNASGSQWVFPGGQTFVFKDAQFSDAQDLVTPITYGDPG